MNNRIAKKILCCKSTLSNNKDKVLRARKHSVENIIWFNEKSIYLIPIDGDNTNTLYNKRL